MFSPAYLWLGSRYPEGSKRDKKKGVESRILFPTFCGGGGHFQRFISTTWRTKPTTEKILAMATCGNGYLLATLRYNLQLLSHPRCNCNLRFENNCILLYKFVKFAVNKRFWHYKFSVYQEWSSLENEIRKQILLPRRSRGCKSCLRFSFL